MRGEGAGDDRIRLSLRLEVQRLGLAAPPSPMWLRFTPLAGGRWGVAVSFEGPRAEALLWIDRHDPSVLRFPKGTDAILHAEFDQTPPGLRGVLDRMTVHEVRLTADGWAMLDLEGDRDKLRKLRILQDAGSLRTLSPARAPATAKGAMLTPRQHEALKLALKSGYFGVPRRVELRDLAGTMGISPPALSELLRRAEERILRHYESQTMGSGDDGSP